MKVNRIIGFAALALTLAVAAVGCVKTDDNGPSNGPVALTKVDAALGASGEQAVTRAIAADPTMTPAADRAAEGHVMRITIGGLTEAYEYNSGKFVPQDKPVYFPGRGEDVVDFWFGLPNGRIADQNGTAGMLLAADVLTASQRFIPANSLSGVTLTHANSLIEVVLDVDPNDVDNVFIGGVPAYNISGTNKYLAVIAPGTDEFMVRLTYKGIPNYEVAVGKDAIVGSVKEFVANNRYTLNIAVDEVSLELRLLAISIARWAEAGNLIAGVVTTIDIDGDSSSDGLYVKFTDGTDLTVNGGGGLFRFYLVTPGLPKVIYSVQRMSGNILVGNEILIGRREGETVYLKMSGDDVVFRDAVGGSVPIGIYAEFALINNNMATLAGQYQQEADLDLLGFSTAPATPRNWSPIGYNGNEFTGTYDGGGFKIENLLINMPSGSYVGLFGYCYNSTLKNIFLSSGSITGRYDVGGICGYNWGDDSEIATITDCVNGATVNGDISVGGVCGKNNARNIASQTIIQNCVNTGNVTGSELVGGICGESLSDNIAKTTVSGCSNSGTVNGNTIIGGICGISSIGSIGAEAIISNCTNSGTISAVANYAGGVCGRNLADDGGTVTISNCTNSGTVSGTGEIGGVCGNNHSEHEGISHISDCTNSGNVSGSGSHIGGVCGYNYAFLTHSHAMITGSTNTGVVGGLDRIGGICGFNNIEQYAEITISGCVNSGNITGTGSSTGGVCGGTLVHNGSGTITDCSNSGSVSGQIDVGGVCGNNYAKGVSSQITLSDCTNSGMVNGTDRISGVFGRNYTEIEGKITISGCTNSGNVTGSNDYIGGVCGENYTKDGDSQITITGCTNSGNVTGVNSVGGVSGQNNEQNSTFHSGIVTITDCTNSGNITGVNSVGGVSGFNFAIYGSSQATITDCTNSGNVNGASSVGGVCGFNEAVYDTSSVTITGCTNLGDVNGENSVGGVCGYNDASYHSSQAMVFGCTNTGTVTGTGSGSGGSIGGVCGFNFAIYYSSQATVSGCTNSGTVTGSGGSIGGVCGLNEASYATSSATITGCTNSGTVTGSGGSTGGVCGNNSAAFGSSQATATGCTNSGTVTGSGGSTGGVCGNNSATFDSSQATVIECYSAAKVTGTSNVGGVCGWNYEESSITYCFWGKGNSSDTSPTVAVGGTGTATNTYEFSATAWPGSPATPGYWEVYPTGRWESLGVWGGSPQTSTYPRLKM